MKQKTLHRALSQALARCEQRPLTKTDRYIIFSDHHKGAHSPGADDFANNEETYLTALEYYLEQGYTLIVLGDAEELWEEDFAAVRPVYEKVFASERRFHQQGRYLRIYGNHDLHWQQPRYVAQHLQPIYPQLKVHEGLVFNFNGGAPARSGRLLLLHGHQGTLFSDRLAWLSAPLVRIFWRTWQNLTNSGHTRTPATEPCLRGQHDTQMYNWARQQARLLLIAGHTHRPVWSSRTHLEKLVAELHALLDLPPAQRALDYDKRLAELKADIQKRQDQHAPCEDAVKTQPVYFNTGCCSFEDGDITGIELADGQIRLIKWGAITNDMIVRTVFEENRLDNIFFVLPE